MTALHFALPSASTLWVPGLLVLRVCDTVQRRVTGSAPTIYLHVVMSGSLLFISTLFNVELVPPPVLADPTSSRVCRSAMLVAPSLRGWIRCVCYGERWLGIGSNEADWALELGCQLSQRQFDAPLCSRSSSLHDTLFSTPAPFHTSGTLKFSKYCRIPHLMLKKKDCST